MLRLLKEHQEQTTHLLQTNWQLPGADDGRFGRLGTHIEVGLEAWKLQGVAKLQEVRVFILNYLHRVKHVNVGDNVDVRDTEYIWCVAQVKMKIESSAREPLILVHYEVSLS